MTQGSKPDAANFSHLPSAFCYRNKNPHQLADQWGWGMFNQYNFIVRFPTHWSHPPNRLTRISEMTNDNISGIT